MRRFLLAILLPVVVLAASSTAAQARSVPFKGRLIGSTNPISQTAGSCMCTANWYTFAANPGSVTVAAALRGYALAFGPVYGIRMTLYAGKQPDGAGQAGCDTRAKHCRQEAVIHTSVRKPTVFYLQVYGPGASTVYFSLRITAHLRQLHCYRVCTGL